MDIVKARRREKGNPKFFIDLSEYLPLRYLNEKYIATMP